MIKDVYKYANPPKLEVEHWVYQINYIYTIPRGWALAKHGNGPWNLRI